MRDHPHDTTRQTLKGPLTLVNLKICPHCDDWITPGEAVFLIEEKNMPDAYMHQPCIAAWVKGGEDAEERGDAEIED